jgi:hypothetical protein
MIRPKPSPASLILAASVLGIAGTAYAAAAVTSVHRCVKPNGQIEFRQTQCPPSTAEQEVTIQDHRTGWVPPKGVKKPPARRAKPRPTKTRDDSAARRRREERCWKKRQQLKDVNWRMRRGYTSAQGEVLRHKQRAYEDYLRQFCR